MKILFFLLLLTPLNHITVIPNVQQQMLSGDWQLEYIMVPGRDTAGLYNKQTPHIRFDSIAARVSGSTGCNRFSGPYTCTGNELHFDTGRMTLTRMACQGDGEGIFIDALKKVTRYDIYDDVLLFLQDDIVLMRWKKKN